MKQTERFGLNLWELGDLIRMEDFNADNERLETALAGLGGITIARGSVGGADCLEAGIPIQDLESWGKWNLVGLLLLARDFQESSGSYILHRPDPACGVQFQTPNPNGLYLFAPGKNGGRTVQGAFLSTDMVRFFRGNRPFQQVETVNVAAYPTASAHTGFVDYFWLGLA